MKLTLSDRERWLIFATMLLVAFYIFFAFLYVPRADEASVLKAKLERKELELNDRKYPKQHSDLAYCPGS